MRFLLAIIIAATCSFGTIKEVRSLPKAQIITWATGDTILLKGLVFVDSSILKIQPGVLIKAQKTKAKYMPDDEYYEIDSITALVVTKKGYIQASGTKEKPIIFTSELDSMNGKQLTYPATVNDSFFGYWGGVVILGAGRVNDTSNSLQFKPAGEEDPRCVYGGKDHDSTIIANNDSSGFLRYVTIRYAGSEHYTRQDANRFAALNLMGVGRKTGIEYVETYRSYNDGIRLHGGAVNLRYAASCKSTKDGIQCDEGYRGAMQFVFIDMEKSSTTNIERASFRIGGTSKVTDTPYTQPFIINSTTHASDVTIPSVQFTKKGAGKIFHSVFHQQCKFKIEENAGVGIPSSWEHVKDSLVDVRGNFFWKVVPSATTLAWADVLEGDSTKEYIVKANKLANPMFKYVVGDSTVAPLDFRPDSILFWWKPWSEKVHIEGELDDTKNVYDTLRDYPVTLDSTLLDSLYKGTRGIDTKIKYAGAFDPIQKMLWIGEWTSLDAYYSITNTEGRYKDTLTHGIQDIMLLTKKANRLFMVPSKTGATLVKLDLASQPAGTVTAKMFRLNGSCAYVKTFGIRAGAHHTLTLDGQLPASGLYIIRCVSAGKTIYSGKVLLP